MALPYPNAPEVGSTPRPRTFGGGYLFGAPVGDLGWFATLLMSLTAGFVSFFAATFFGIIGVMVGSAVTHRTLDYSISYMWIGLPVGLTVLVIALLYLGSLWIKRIMRRA